MPESRRQSQALEAKDVCVSTPFEALDHLPAVGVHEAGVDRVEGARLRVRLQQPGREAQLLVLDGRVGLGANAGADVRRLALGEEGVVTRVGRSSRAVAPALRHPAKSGGL